MCINKLISVKSDQDYFPALYKAVVFPYLHSETLNVKLNFDCKSDVYKHVIYNCVHHITPISPGLLLDRV